MASTVNYRPETKTPDTPPITADLLMPSDGLHKRLCRSSPSSPLFRRKCNRRCNSFRTKSEENQEGRKSQTPPFSPQSFVKSIRKKLRPQKLSPPSLALPSPSAITPPSIKVSPIDPLHPSQISSPCIQVSSEHHLSPLSPPSVKVGFTDHKRENRGTKHDATPTYSTECREEEPQPNELRTDQSISSMESGYISSDPRRSKLSLDSRGSVSNILEGSGEIDQQNQPRKSSDEDGRRVTQESDSFSNTACYTTVAEKPHFETNVSDKHIHPKTLFHTGLGSSNVNTLGSISERSPPNQSPNSSSSDPSSPANSTTSSSSLISSSISPCSSRRSSVSYSSFRNSRRCSLSRSSSITSRDFHKSRKSSFKRQRTSVTTVTKFYRVTLKKYLKKSRATSALNVSEVMSDDEESITGSLRRLQISIPHLGNQQQEKGDQESSDKMNGTHTGKHQHPVITKTRHKETPVKLSQIPTQQFGSSTPFPSCSHDIDEDTKTWFQREVRELKRKLAKYSRDSRRIQRDMKEDTERVCSCKTSSNPSSSCGTKSSDSVCIFLNVQTNDYTRSTSVCHGERNRCSSMASCVPLPPQRNVREPSELPSEKVDRAVIRDLSQVLLFWIWPARLLGLEDSDIETIQLDNPGDTREQSYKMLHTWVQRYGQSATYQTLGRVLLTEASGVYPRYVEIVSKHCS